MHSHFYTLCQGLLITRNASSDEDDGDDDGGSSNRRTIANKYYVLNETRFCVTS